MALSGLAFSQPALRYLGLVAAVGLAACSQARPGPDEFELATISHWKEVPKSSPARFVGTFDRFCTGRPAGKAAMDDALRSAGFVPKVRASGRRPGVYVVDDNRPAVVVSDRLCGVRAIARTGQTNRVNRYVAQTYPAARPVDPAAFPDDVEQVWAIDGGLVATTRNDWVGNRSAYSLVHFKPEP